MLPYSPSRSRRGAPTSPSSAYRTSMRTARRSSSSTTGKGATRGRHKRTPQEDTTQGRNKRGATSRKGYARGATQRRNGVKWAPWAGPDAMPKLDNGRRQPGGCYTLQRVLFECVEVCVWLMRVREVYSVSIVLCLWLVGLCCECGMTSRCKVIYTRKSGEIRCHESLRFGPVVFITPRGPSSFRVPRLLRTPFSCQCRGPASPLPHCASRRASWCASVVGASSCHNPGRAHTTRLAQPLHTVHALRWRHTPLRSGRSRTYFSRVICCKIF